MKRKHYWRSKLSLIVDRSATWWLFVLAALTLAGVSVALGGPY